MNILVVTQKLFTSDVSGLAKRLYPFLKELEKIGHSITLISFYEKESELKNLPKKNEYYDRIITVKLNRKLAYTRMIKAIFTGKPFKLEFCNTLAMKKAVAKELKNKKYDILYAHYYKMANFLELYKNYPRVVDLCDAFAIRFDKQIPLEKNPIKRFFLKQERNRMYNYEKRCIKIFDKCIYISETDRQFMTDTNTIQKTEVISNGVDTDYFCPLDNDYNRHEINYIGLMSYVANHDAVMYFIKNIYPLIQQQIPDVTFKIIGKNPKQELIDFVKHDSSIKVTGFVEDIRKEIETSCVSVAPVRIGAGIQNKILEAMSMGLPVVTTKFGAEGISDDENILLIGQSEQDFANKVCELLKHEDLRNKYSNVAREFCINNFSWSSNANKISKVFKELCNKNKKGIKCI